ncbi:hypothetical protein COW36_00075 [bacterium (Candidatus Blackallbacteria) CG17_big_fil_post_rev_8_21_14_2_50_48_46]|uniref:Lipoprotein n=1 Tax=bacterium (Candidatus Blackallbacteria) CG17_big_fil_post_rev_8_21_14_2_50_48_46 TaxID=2014261 RepID=A0A2M7GCG5_9BACT|nr:MAG: hypothetical protein COW64_07815 [bacterium (Candidatus Blackallbacteria) CG18_big_fil_WC_8_21_14_2_50_49_26]PIW19663.1 MAG: hypothetical protein COW36_00075 [bacterium (Candidatus Blackallbacteria) CG17_big_fil_post_rev_8_21_14_2_50_48_46]PIW44734.1 MAG: hypothetical protein COW20_22990 [bacterium (Candidatus Blackallbacteria) CG13_big_fil_rev_8_21_14_2_50_49_14]
MYKKASYLLGAAAFVLLTGCGGNEYEKVIRENLKGLQSQNLNQVMATIDRQSPAYESTKQQVTELIKGYNLEFKIESMDVFEAPSNEKQQAEKSKTENQDALGVTEELAGMITEADRDKAMEERRRKELEESQRPLIAKVKVVQVTKKKKDNISKFTDNRITVVHTLYKYPSDEKPAWKIFSSEITAGENLPAS